MTECAAASSISEVVVLDSKVKMRVLQVDDDLSFLNIAKQCLELDGSFQVDTASSVDEAFEKMKTETYDAVISDYQMPGKTGLQFLKELRQNANTIPFILFTGKGTEEAAIKALNLGANHYLNKTGDPETVYAELAHSIREAMRSSERTRTSLKRYKSFIQATGELEWATNAEGEIIEDLPSFREFTGQTYQEIKSWNWARALHPNDSERTAKTWKEAYENKSKYEVEYRLRRHDGIYRSFLARGVPLFNDDGSIKEWVGSCTDITDLKKAEQDATETQTKFAALFNENPEATVYLDENLQILDINSRFKSLFGYSTEEVKGKKLNEMVVPPNLTDEGQTLDTKAADGYVYHDTIRMKKDKTLIPVSVSAAPISIQGRIAGYIGVYKDISGQKKAETKLAMMNEKLRVIGGLTRHDVRNKLSIITANTYLSKKKLQDHPEIIESLKDMESACDMILRIFDFARDYERLGVEELTYVNVEDCVQKAASFFTSINGTKTENKCKGLTVFADSLLRQLFYNLIDNSMKYGEHVTHINIRYKETGDQIKLIYEDDGVGISTEAKTKIFSEGFTTGKGSGYGLYFIKKMMEVYGWTIQEAGTPGRGVQFIMTIPHINSQGKDNYQIVKQ